VKTVILDENIPRKLKKLLSGHRVATVPEMGWGGVKNGRLIALIDGTYEVFITADKNLRYQQNLRHRNLSIIEVPFNDAVRLLPIAPPKSSRQSKNPRPDPTKKFRSQLPAPESQPKSAGGLRKGASRRIVPMGGTTSVSSQTSGVTRRL
jgi:hypothetical protein